MGEEEKDRTLEITPTWATALVCSIFVIASLALERAIHYTGKWLSQREERSRSKPLLQALEKTKEELMLLGFISIMLSAFEGPITGICRSPTRHMVPCKELLDAEMEHFRGRCPEGKVPFISRASLHKLHIFIFVLAIVHMVYSCLTLLLARYKVHRWGAWEDEIQISLQSSQNNTEPNQLKRLTTFLRKRGDPGYMSSELRSWIVCFLRQFTMSVSRSDYKALRLGFINKHNLRSNFDFHRYIMRVLEDDFREVVGISGLFWLFVVLFLLLNIEGWNAYFWISFLPLGLLLVIGAKLQRIIMLIAIDVAKQQDDPSTNTINLRDDLFWYKNPMLIIRLLHFILFQNAFELALFFWIWRALGFTSCIMEKIGFLVTRLVIGVMVQVLCSYSTLPLYALVTQMGSHYKAPIFNEQVQNAVTSWHAKARERVKHRQPEAEAEIAIIDTI